MEEPNDEIELMARLTASPVYVTCHECGHQQFDRFKFEDQECQSCGSCDLTVERA